MDSVADTPPAQQSAVEPLVLDLGGAGAAALRLVGGKALNLGKLVAAGLPVPSGFCLTTVAYELAAPPGLDALAAELDAIGSGTGTGTDRAALGIAAGRARALIGESPIPSAVDAAVRTAYGAMGGALPVAVRSSATAEDLPFASFAGQQDSYLDVVGADAVVEAVRRCWASLWSDRAVAYRSANGISNRDVGLAVVVQAMADAATAGVLFTANPVTGTRTETLINAGPGSGQAVVSGAVNPDQFVLETASGRVTSRTPGGKEPGLSPGPDDAQLQELTALGDSVQRLLGAPQDIEWAIDSGGKLWLTQSRPITTLYPLPEPAPEDAAAGAAAPTRVYLCGTLFQGLTRPITPMGLAVLEVMRNSKGPWRYVNPGLRMYVDLTAVARNKYGRAYLLRVLPLADGRSGAVMPALLEDPRFSLIEHSFRESLREAAARRRLPHTAPRNGDTEQTDIVVVMLRLIPAMLRPAFRPAAELRRAKKYGKQLESGLSLAEPASAVQRLDYTRAILDRTIGGLIQATLPGPSLGYVMLAVARRLLRGIAAPRELEAVLRGLPHNITTEMDLELWRLAVSIGDDPVSRGEFLTKPPEDLSAAYLAGKLPPQAQAGVRGFLARYGHRAVAEIDLGMPRWSEKPDHILGMISNYLRVEDPEQAPDRQFARATEHAEDRIRSLVDRTRARSPWRARALELSLRRVRQLAGMRELPKFYIVLVLAEMHQQLLRIGADMASAGTIAAADDVFFLDFDELRVGLRGADLHRIVADRRRLYDVELRRRRIPRLLLSDGTDVEAAMMAKKPAPGALAGTPASAGTATGRVRVIMDPVGAHLEPGEILVAPSTDPGWTPLFLTAGALVMEMGGVISHGAVVAREYGIPAVVGVPDATTRLRTGQTVTVDGAAGTIREEP
ncbi:PEP/pyruvate-binding domain-containing protein [Arthrobacter sp. PsM3]|uniref:PEP/pyruvate-binding domain-containing protein n=1 Tax=Arthrobacter sp. PsM3 TaxID=3030531 RepID=UPI00263B9FE2|nr:PEP/pyruvate-binding domain-containing protein [Arthrobacter sp. PsM3]MDN4642743.1 PEP/pyruvate-binding domain-containing protein [Arthrobacter sp. PsM3]